MFRYLVLLISLQLLLLLSLATNNNVLFKFVAAAPAGCTDFSFSSSVICGCALNGNKIDLINYNTDKPVGITWAQNCVITIRNTQVKRLTIGGAVLDGLVIKSGSLIIDGLTCAMDISHTHCVSFKGKVSGSGVIMSLKNVVGKIVVSTIIISQSDWEPKAFLLGFQEPIQSCKKITVENCKFVIQGATDLSLSPQRMEVTLARFYGGTGNLDQLEFTSNQAYFEWASAYTGVKVLSKGVRATIAMFNKKANRIRKMEFRNNKAMWLGGGNSHRVYSGAWFPSLNRVVIADFEIPLVLDAATTVTSTMFFSGNEVKVEGKVQWDANDWLFLHVLRAKHGINFNNKIEMTNNKISASIAATNAGSLNCSILEMQQGYYATGVANNYLLPKDLLSLTSNQISFSTPTNYGTSASNTATTYFMAYIANIDVDAASSAPCNRFLFDGNIISPSSFSSSSTSPSDLKKTSSFVIEADFVKIGICSFVQSAGTVANIVMENNRIVANVKSQKSDISAFYFGHFTTIPGTCISKSNNVTVVVGVRDASKISTSGDRTTLTMYQLGAVGGNRASGVGQIILQEDYFYIIQVNTNVALVCFFYSQVSIGPTVSKFKISNIKFKTGRGAGGEGGIHAKDLAISTGSIPSGVALIYSEFGLRDITILIIKNNYIFFKTVGMRRIKLIRVKSYFHGVHTFSLVQNSIEYDAQDASILHPGQDDVNTHLFYYPVDLGSSEGSCYSCTLLVEYNTVNVKIVSKTSATFSGLGGNIIASVNFNSVKVLNNIFTISIRTDQTVVNQNSVRTMIAIVNFRIANMSRELIVDDNTLVCGMKTPSSTALIVLVATKVGKFMKLVSVSKNWFTVSQFDGEGLNSDAKTITADTVGISLLRILKVDRFESSSSSSSSERGMISVNDNTFDVQSVSKLNNLYVRSISTLGTNSNLNATSITLNSSSITLTKINVFQIFVYNHIFIGVPNQVCISSIESIDVSTTISDVSILPTTSATSITTTIPLGYIKGIVTSGTITKTFTSSLELKDWKWNVKNIVAVGSSSSSSPSDDDVGGWKLKFGVDFNTNTQLPSTTDPASNGLFQIFFLRIRNFEINVENIKFARNGVSSQIGIVSLGSNLPNSSQMIAFTLRMYDTIMRIKNSSSSFSAIPNSESLVNDGGGGVFAFEFLHLQTTAQTSIKLDNVSIDSVDLSNTVAISKDKPENYLDVPTTEVVLVRQLKTSPLFFPESTRKNTLKVVVRYCNIRNVVLDHILYVSFLLLHNVLATSATVRNSVADNISVIYQVAKPISRFRFYQLNLFQTARVAYGSGAIFPSAKTPASMKGSVEIQGNFLKTGGSLSLSSSSSSSDIAGVDSFCGTATTATSSQCTFINIYTTTYRALAEWTIDRNDVVIGSSSVSSNNNNVNNDNNNDPTISLVTSSVSQPFPVPIETQQQQQKIPTINEFYFSRNVLKSTNARIFEQDRIMDKNAQQVYFNFLCNKWLKLTEKLFNNTYLNTISPQSSFVACGWTETQSRSRSLPSTSESISHAITTPMPIPSYTSTFSQTLEPTSTNEKTSATKSNESTETLSSVPTRTKTANISISRSLSERTESVELPEPPPLDMEPFEGANTLLAVGSIIGAVPGAYQLSRKVMVGALLLDCGEDVELIYMDVGGGHVSTATTSSSSSSENNNNNKTKNKIRPAIKQADRLTDLTFEVNPTMLAFGDGNFKTYIGVLLGNPLLLLGFYMILVVLTWIVMTIKNISYEKSSTKVTNPGWTYVFLCLFSTASSYPIGVVITSNKMSETVGLMLMILSLVTLVILPLALTFWSARRCNLKETLIVVSAFDAFSTQKEYEKVKLKEKQQARKEFLRKRLQEREERRERKEQQQSTKTVRKLAASKARKQKFGENNNEDESEDHLLNNNNSSSSSSSSSTDSSSSLSGDEEERKELLSILEDDWQPMDEEVFAEFSSEMMKNETTTTTAAAATTTKGRNAAASVVVDEIFAEDDERQIELEMETDPNAPLPLELADGGDELLKPLPNLPQNTKSFSGRSLREHKKLQKERQVEIQRRQEKYEKDVEIYKETKRKEKQQERRKKHDEFEAAKKRQDEHEAKLSYLQRFIRYLVFPWKEWVASDFVKKWGPFFDPYSLPLFSLLDVGVPIIIGISSGTATSCKHKSCCQGIALFNVSVAGIHFIALCWLRPYMNRLDVGFNSVAIIATLVQCCVVAAALFGSSHLSSMVEVMSQVSSSAGLVVVFFAFVQYAPKTRKIFRRCCMPKKVSDADDGGEEEGENNSDNDNDQEDEEDFLNRGRSKGRTGMNHLNYLSGDDVSNKNNKNKKMTQQKQKNEKTSSKKFSTPKIIIDEDAMIVDHNITPSSSSSTKKEKSSPMIITKKNSSSSSPRRTLKQLETEFTNNNNTSGVYQDYYNTSQGNYDQEEELVDLGNNKNSKKSSRNPSRSESQNNNNTNTNSQSLLFSPRNNENDNNSPSPNLGSKSLSSSVRSQTSSASQQQQQKEKGDRIESFLKEQNSQQHFFGQNSTQQQQQPESQNLYASPPLQMNPSTSLLFPQQSQQESFLNNNASSNSQIIQQQQQQKEQSQKHQNQKEELEKQKISKTKTKQKTKKSKLDEAEEHAVQTSSSQETKKQQQQHLQEAVDDEHEDEDEQFHDGEEYVGEDLMRLLGMEEEEEEQEQKQ